jgi:hypothetical protein
LSIEKESPKIRLRVVNILIFIMNCLFNPYFCKLKFHVKIMKIFRYIALSSILVAGLNSCKKEPENQWKVEVKDPVER